MSSLSQWISIERTYLGAFGLSKKKVLQTISECLAEHTENIDANALYDGLIARERLGATAMGGGIAIPHCRLDACSHPLVSLFCLSDSVDFEAPDRLPVDLLVVLIVPLEATDEHLSLLAEIAQKLSDESLVARLRASKDSRELYQNFMES